MSVRSVSEQLYLKVFSTQKVNFVKSFYSGRTFAVFITLVVFFPTGWIFFCGKSKTFCQNFKIFRKNIICFLKEKKSFAFNLLVESWNYRSATPPPQPPQILFHRKSDEFLLRLKTHLGKTFLSCRQTYFLGKFPLSKEASSDEPSETFFYKTPKTYKSSFFFTKIFLLKKQPGHYNAVLLTFW